VTELKAEAIEAVAIGTSAGGVQALLAILPALRETSQLAIFIVIHLPRDQPSLLVDVFSARCRLPVREAEDKEPVVPGTIYFAPPNYHLLVDRGPHLVLSADDLVHHCRPSIDVLFDSAADVYQDRLLGILLTGANEDGAEGLVSIRDAGGFTVVQSPETAYSSRMLRAAIDLQTPDLVLPLEEIATLLRGVGGAAPMIEKT
jgi:two-component system chemotaxis response regulator CheB